MPAGILSEIGNIQRFACDDAKVAKYGGLKWCHYQSGEFEAEQTPLTRHGNHLPALLSGGGGQPRAETRAGVRGLLRQEVRGGQDAMHTKRALVLTARKLVRLVTALLATNQPYRARSTDA